MLPLKHASREAQAAVGAGAHELDMIVDHAMLLRSDYESAYREIAAVRSLAPRPVVLKLVLEVALLAPGAIVAACLLAANARADFVAAGGCSGCGGGDNNGVRSVRHNGRPARPDDVRLIRAALDRITAAEQAGGGLPGAGAGRRVGVKASGGVRSLAEAVALLDAGADRVGASGCVWIMREASDAVERMAHLLGSGDIYGDPRLGISRLYSED